MEGMTKEAGTLCRVLLEVFFTKKACGSVSNISEILVSVLMVGLFYGTCHYTKHVMQNFLTFRDSPIIPSRRSPTVNVTCNAMLP